jgi:hypothetical protein
MAYVVARAGGSWEIRESHSTPAGPRSRTLATFKTLTPDVLERARARSATRLDPQALRKAALRAGAPVAHGDADRASGELLRELAAGARPRPVLRGLLRDALGPERPSMSDSARAAARWATAAPAQRGETLRDLLLLADRLPGADRGHTARISGLAGARAAPPRFPRVRSTPA